ncbi:MAG TPA: MOSC domain-containing protein [Prolixibacteraceae bacterium]|nr:MOSC domain-containing protein [Prolixibacteraceae bacterium]
MQIISANIGEPVQIEWRGQQVYTGIFKYEINAPVFLGREDVVNDHVLDRRYHGGADKACYLYSADHYPFWKTKYPDLDWQWGMFGENLTVRGLNESEIHIGDTYQVGEAVVQVAQPRQPCFKLGVRFGNQEVVNDFWSLPYPGVYVRVLQPGKVQKGDEIVLLDQNPDCLSVSQIFSIFRSTPPDRKLIQKAIENQFLAESCRRDIQKILEKR